ncbi:MAG: hypothetical protein ACE5JO_07350 [Candidatus Binatia bacterium]
MTPIPCAQMEIQRFFSMMFVTGLGYIEIRPFTVEYKPVTDKRIWIPSDDKARAAAAAFELRDRYHVFFGVCTRSQEGGTKEDVNELVALWADVDEKHYEWGLSEALDRIEAFQLEASAIVSSGNGYHVYWFLQEPYSLKGEGIAKAEAMLKALQQDELGADLTADVSRILRVPNTLNLKDPDDPKLVKIVKLKPVRHGFEEFEKALDWEAVLEADYDVGAKEEMWLGLEEAVYEEIEPVLQSDFIQYCQEHAETLSEPLWYAMITNLIVFKGGREKIHELSRPYPEYSWQETEWKIKHALEDAPGPHTCKYLEEHGFYSGDCEKYGVKSPAGLAFVGKLKLKVR